MNTTGILIIAFIVTIIVSLGGGGIVGWHERAVRVPAELTAQMNTDQANCEKAQQVTKDANDALQKDHDSIAAKLRSLKLQHNSTVVVPVTSGANLSGRGNQHAGQNGNALSTDTLRDYAAEAEQYRSQFVVCKGVLDQERAAK